MATPGPRYSELCHSFVRTIDLFRDYTPDPAKRKLVAKMNSEIEDYERGIDFNALSASDVDTEKGISSSASDLIERVYGKIVHDLDTEQRGQANSYKTIALKASKAFREVVLHRRELEINGLEPFLHEEWAFEQFVLLLLNRDEWAVNKLVELLENGDPTGLHALVNLDEMFEESKKLLEPLFDIITELAIKLPDLQISLLAHYVVSRGRGGLAASLAIRMADFEAPYGLVEDISRVTERAECLIDYFCGFKEADEYCVFDWDALPMIFRLKFFRSYFIRQRKLVGLCRGHLGPREFYSKTRDECFPLTRTILMSYRVDNADVVDFVSRSIKGSSISIVLFVQKEVFAQLDDRYEQMSNIKIVLTDANADIWVQDYCTVFEDAIRPASSFHPQPDLAESLEGVRSRRMYEREKNKFTDLESDCFGAHGNSIDFCETLKMHEHLHQLDPTSDLTMQFTPIEGGNCLLGRDCAYVGEDTVEHAFMAIAEELIELRVIGNQAELSVGTVKALLALDLGLDSAEKVHTIEQPDYHLDVASVIVRDDADKKVVWVNDSIMAMHEWEAYADKHVTKRDDLEDDDGPVDYDLRLGKIWQDAFDKKTYEDAAAEDYARAGFEVIRVAGEFANYNTNYPDNHRINFFNFTTITTPEGKRVILALGGGFYFRQKFRELVRLHIGEDAEVRFVPEEASYRLLAARGGIHCCTKRTGMSLKVPDKAK